MQQGSIVLDNILFNLTQIKMIISKAIALLGIIMVFNCKGELIKARRNTDIV